jgi:GH24 family phage-related lysozyme (muramidase)
MYNERIFDKIKSEEGEQLEAYLCSAGYWTVGVGHNLETKMSDTERNVFTSEQLQLIENREYDKIRITKKQSTDLLVIDLKQTASDYESIFGYYCLHPAAELVVYDMLFQMGRSSFSRFTNTIELLRKGEYTKAGSEILVGSDASKPSKYFQDTPNRAYRNHEILCSIECDITNVDKIIERAIKRAEESMRIIK